MMKFKKAVSWLLVFVLAITLSACSKSEGKLSSNEKEETEQKKTKDYMTLLYSAADTFNPYTLKTDTNRQLCRLLYEPLVKTDNEFNPVFSVAKNVTVSGTSCTAILKPVKFSDGTVLTASDVVYSFNLAKKSGGIYAAELYGFSSASAADSQTVNFTLKKVDPYAANLLTFPIIKSGSDKVKDSDGVLQPPIGSGRYKLNEANDGLLQNNEYSAKSSIKKIRLINAPDAEAVEHYAQIGAADMYYSNISDGNILRMSGKKLDINLNSLVYIGINQNYGALAQNAVRQAISTGIDRTGIAKNSYYNNAFPATGFFSPVWSEVKSVQNIQIESNSQITVENLEKIGYNSLNSNGCRVNSAGSALSFTLLVNSENRLKASAARLVAEQLRDYGIFITIVEKPYAEYAADLAAGNFQLFIGEVKLTKNMDISSLVTSGSGAAFGLNPEANQSQKVVEGFYSGKNTIADVASVLQTEMPLVPILYRTGVLFYNDKIENVEDSSETDIYFSIESYIYNK